MNYLEAAQAAILRTHGCKASYVESVAITERYQDEIVWDGQVESLPSITHQAPSDAMPGATRMPVNPISCACWASDLLSVLTMP